MKNLRVLVTNAELKNSLAIVRSLGKKGFYVISAGHNRVCQSFLSKYSKYRYIYTNPRKNAEKFINDLLNFVKKNDCNIILPVGADATVPLALHKEKFLPYVKLPIANYNAVMKAHNKQETMALAKKIGVAIPKTFSPKNEEELEKIAYSIDYPVVIKPRKSSASVGLRYAFSPEDLLEKYKIDIKSNAIFDYTNPLIQEYVPGEIHDVCVLFNNGEMVAGLTQKRIWQYPISGGWGVVNETTDEPHLLELTSKLLKNMKWHGVAQVEFKIDSRNSKPKLIEVNPKFWGTLELSITAGIDFPYLLCKIAMEEEVEPVFEYKKGLKFAWINYGFFGNILQSENFCKKLKEAIDICKTANMDISLEDFLPHLITLFPNFMKALKETIHSSKRLLFSTSS